MKLPIECKTHRESFYASHDLEQKVWIVFWFFFFSVISIDFFMLIETTLPLCPAIRTLTVAVNQPELLPALGSASFSLVWKTFINKKSLKEQDWNH